MATTKSITKKCTGTGKSRICVRDGSPKGEHIKVFNNGDMIRDFTYIDNIAEFMKCCKSDKNPLR
ncbi:hypothetical protein [Fibrobacter sp. UWR2]|uniref:hypothetical protein n=1 Tax=Fibrobacter sp. UWR2 TaxID=1964352 RepID=UPI001182C046|nr:hypothetical protein [Fibrobacter sp. UWR2]